MSKPEVQRCRNPAEMTESDLLSCPCCRSAGGRASKRATNFLAFAGMWKVACQNGACPLSMVYFHPDEWNGLPRISMADHESARAADKARIAELTEALKSAREMASDWGAYASEYFREKHCLEKDLADLDAAIDATLAQQGKEGEA